MSVPVWFDLHPALRVNGQGSKVMRVWGLRFYYIYILFKAVHAGAVV